DVVEAPGKVVRAKRGAKEKKKRRIHMIVFLDLPLYYVVLTIHILCLMDKSDQLTKKKVTIIREPKKSKNHISNTDNYFPLRDHDNKEWGWDDSHKMKILAA
ncbi:hypothetical protein ACJX0J_030909, partial [Zea mays]